MNSAVIGKFSLEIDSDLTEKIYASIAEGGSTHCKCAYCKNFSLQLPSLFPSEVLSFFSQAGIDPLKDAEVYELGEGPEGKRCYQGEYYFVASGNVPDGGGETLASGLQFAFLTGAGPLSQDQFKGVQGATCFQFTYDIPWVLRENP